MMRMDEYQFLIIIGTIVLYGTLVLAKLGQIHLDIAATASAHAAKDKAA